eukprot:XP_001698563.1 predicted protein [Chlamydomonas reinhardtii]
MWRLMQVTKWRCALFGVFLGVPNPSIRALANRKIAEEYDEDSTVVEGQLDAADKDQALVPQQNSASGPGLDREAAAGVSAEGTGATDKVAAAPSNLRLSWRQRTAAWQESVVRFFRMQYQRPGSRKVLAYNSVRNWWLCLPVVIWAILIIAMYAVSYTLVTNLYEPIETVNIASFVVMRNTRLVYFAHELCVLSDPTIIPAYRRSLSDRRIVAGVEYDVLLYGNKYYTPALLANMSTGVHRIGKSSGIISATSSIQNVLFFTRECLRADPSTQHTQA